MLRSRWESNSGEGGAFKAARPLFLEDLPFGTVNWDSVVWLLPRAESALARHLSAGSHFRQHVPGLFAGRSLKLCRLVSTFRW